MRLAWNDSAADDPARRHEEGGYILQDDGTYSLARWPSGGLARIVPPPRAAHGTYQSLRVVGEFHTHPNPAVDELGRLWYEGPSPGDIAGIRGERCPDDSYAISRNSAFRIGNDGSTSILGTWAEVLTLSA